MRVRVGSCLVLPAILSLALALGGCGADSGETRSRDESRVDVDGLPVSVRVVFPGFGRLDQLRYRFEEGEQATWQMRVDLDTTIDGTSSNLPPFTLTVATEVQRSSQEESDLMVSVRDIVVGDGVGTPTEPEQSLAGLVDPLRETRGTIVLGSDGGLVRSSFKLPPQLTPALKVTLSGLADGSAFVPPLPTEPVGFGAEWVASNTISLRRTTIDKQAKYTVQPDGDGGGLGLKYQTEQGVEISGSGETTSGTSTSKGRWDGSLTQLGGSTTEGQQTTNVDLPSGEGSVVVELDADVSTTADPG